MEKELKNLSILDFKFSIFILNAGCLLTSFWLGYNHYYHPAGKGVDDYILALGIYSIHSFFMMMAALNFDTNKKKVKIWLILGILYAIANTVFLVKHILIGQGINALIIIAGSIPFLLFSISLFAVNNQKLFQFTGFSIAFIGLITGAFPTFAILIAIFSLLFSAFYKI